MALYANTPSYTVTGAAEYPVANHAAGYSLLYPGTEPATYSAGYPYAENQIYRNDQSFEERLEYNEDSGFGDDNGYRDRVRDTYRDERAQREAYRERERDDRRGREEGEYRDRERDRDRSRRKDRDRDRRRDQRKYRDKEGRDRDRRDRSRDKDRERERSPDKFDDDFDDGSKESRDLRDERGGEKWMTDTPTNTVLLRGLPPEIDEKDLHLHIRAELMMLRIPVKDIRLMRRKDTGASRGFAFVEFQNVADSQRWMEQTQGKLVLLNQHTVSLYYSTPKTGGEKPADHKTDWACSKCGAHNFKRRDYCFKCSISREESERTKEGDGFDQVGTNPCNTLIFRGLDALTTEEKLVQAIKQASTATVKNIKIIRDELTNTSRGYGFAELSSIQEATVLLETLNNLNPIFEVDGKQILVSFAKNTFNTVMATIGSWNQQQGSWNSSEYYDYSSYSQTYDSTGQYYDYSTYYGRADSTNAAAAVAQAAIQQAHAAKNYNKPASTESAETETTSSQEELPADYPKYPPPDVSTYQYEETSGYYYDPSTGLYYDASSQYYFNSQSSQFMYWDAEKSTYLPAPSQNADSDGSRKEDPKKDKEKKEKVKIAKKIAKDMEKWAKSLNAQKEAMKEGIKRVILPLGQQQKLTERESATADAGFAILEKSTEKTKEDKWLMPPPSMPNKGGKDGGKAAGLVDYGGDSDSEDDETSSGGNSAVSETKLVDWGKIACLLCKRQFNTKEMLTKHTQLSDLHKQNLEALMKSKMNAAQMEAFDKGKEGYRDRAKERRQKYGAAAPPVPKKKQISLFEEPVIAEQPTKAGLGQDNIGNKMLQKMGWSMGQGLGKAGQGRTDPIQTQRRVVQAGLGARGANVTSAPGDTYKDAVKKTMFARYHEVE